MGLSDAKEEDISPEEKEKRDRSLQEWRNSFYDKVAFQPESTMTPEEWRSEILIPLINEKGEIRVHKGRKYHYHYENLQRLCDSYSEQYGGVWSIYIESQS